MLNIEFVPECFAETELVRHVLFKINSEDYLNHAGGIHQVSKIMKGDEIQNFIKIGFVDNDKKNIPQYFAEFELISECSGMLFKKHSINNHYLFVAKPAIEKFIISQLEEINKKATDYDLPDDFKEFCNKLKKSRLASHQKFKELIIELKRSNTSGISFMVEKINELRSAL